MYPSAGGMHSSEDFGEDVEVGLEKERPGCLACQFFTRRLVRRPLSRLGRVWAYNRIFRGLLSLGLYLGIFGAVTV